MFFFLHQKIIPPFDHMSIKQFDSQKSFVDTFA